MNRIRDDLFSSAAFTRNENRRRARRNLLDHARDIPHFGARINEASRAILLQLLTQLTVFARQILLLCGFFDSLLKSAVGS